MGNCQAAEAATVVIVHPGNKIDRIYCSVTANQIMDANPGHYVAQLVVSSDAKSDPSQQLKLLRPHDTLHIGHVYRLITFEDVLKEFSSKKCVKLGKLLKQTERVSREKRKDKKDSNLLHNPLQMEQEVCRAENSSSSSGLISSNSSSRGIVARHQHYQGGQWRPALQSIAEIGS